MISVQTFYHLAVERSDGALETFDSVVPFPAFQKGQRLELLEHAGQTYFVHDSFYEIGHTRDQKELHITLRLVVEHHPPE